MELRLRQQEDHDERTVRVLTLFDESTRKCLVIRVARRLGSLDVIDAVADVMLFLGIPERVRSDNRPEFVAKELRSCAGSWGPRPCNSNRGIGEKTATAKSLTGSCGLTAQMKKTSAR